MFCLNSQSIANFYVRSETACGSVCLPMEICPFSIIFQKGWSSARELIVKTGMVVHAYNPSYSGGWGSMSMNPRPAWAAQWDTHKQTHQINLFYFWVVLGNSSAGEHLPGIHKVIYYTEHQEKAMLNAMSSSALKTLRSPTLQTGRGQE